MFVALVALLAADSGWRTFVPLGSAIFAGLAFVVALLNRATAKKALRMSEQQEERRRAKLDLSLKDAVSYRDADRGCRWIAVQILAVNPTDRDGSLISADLNVTYRSSGREVLLKLAHDTRGNPFGPGRRVVEVPVSLPANDAVSGWLLFRVDDELIDGPIDRYDIVVIDSRGPVEVIQAWAFTEVADANAHD